MMLPGALLLYFVCMTSAGSLITLDSGGDEGVDNGRFSVALLAASSPPFVYVVVTPSTVGLVSLLVQELSSSATSVVIFQLASSEDLAGIHDLFDKDLMNENEKHVVLLLDDSDMVLDLFEQIRRRALESLRLRWYVPTLAGKFLGPLEALLREGTWVAVGVRSADNSVDIFSTRMHSDNLPKLVRIGSWRPRVPGSSSSSPRGGDKTSPGEVLLWEKLFPILDDYYSDFQGRRLISPTIPGTPWYYVKKGPGPQELIPTGGIDVRIANSVAQALNFTFKVVAPLDHRWGGPLPNGSVTGMIGMVARHEAHFAIDQITVTSSRESVVDFTNPYFIAATTIISRAPAEKSRALAVLRPFSLQVWLCLAAVVGSAGVLLFGVTVTARRVRREEDAMETAESGALLLQELSFNMFRCVVIQGNRTKVFLPAPRILVAFWYFFCLNIFIVYSGILTSFLTLPSFEPPIDSLSDMYLATQTRGAILGLRAGTSQEFLFKFAEVGVYAQLWTTMRHRNYDIGFKTALERMFTDDLSYVGDDVTLTIRSAKLGSFKFHVARSSFYPQPFGIACPRGSPYRNAFSLVLLRLQEAGLVSKWVKDELVKAEAEGYRANLDSLRTKGELPILSLKHLQSALVLYGGGMALAGVALVMEVVVFHC